MHTDSGSVHLDRRRFLRVAGLGSIAATAISCAPAAQVPAPAPGVEPAKAGWEAEWDRLVVAAKQEGKVVVNWTGQGSGYAKIMDAFKAAFPGMETEHTTMIPSSLLWTRLHQERASAIYTWDLISVPLENAMRNFFPEGKEANADPIRPVIFRPDVLDDKGWRDGFETGFLDDDKKWAFAFLFGERPQLWMNTDLVKEGELKTAKDLLDPKWKGRIIATNAESGAQLWLGTILRLNLGDEFVKELYTTRNITFVRDVRQLTEALARGTYALGIGVDIGVLKEFRVAGLGNNVRPLRLPETIFAAATSPFWLVNKAPHPNAAKLFLNWFLTKEGQTAYTTNILDNSRRTDVPQGAPEQAAQAGYDYKYVLGRQKLIDTTNSTPPFLKSIGVP